MHSTSPNEGFDSVESLLASFESVTERNRIALSFYRGRGLVGRVTYGELHVLVNKMAGYLATTLAIHSGDRVLVLAPNRLEIPVLLLALLRIGAVVVPLNPTTSPDDWNYIARHSKARGLFTTEDLKKCAEIQELGFLIAIEELLSITRSFTAKTPDPVRGLEDLLAIILYTSGTTGNPKGVGLSQRNLLRNAWSMAIRFDLNRTTQFAVLPLYHAHALGFGLMTSLSTGGHLVFTDKLDPFAWAEIIRSESVVFTSVVPNLLPMLLAARVHREKVPTLQSILVSSAPLSTAQAREFETKTEIRLTQGWGLSEYTNFACCLNPADTPGNHAALLLTPEIPSIGSPLLGTEVKITDLDGKPVSENEPGELCVRGHSLMLGYYGDEETTRGTLLDGWLRTGDQGLYRDYLGKPVFFITGRIKEIIIRSGEKYSPLAIEKKIFAMGPEFEGKLVVLGFPHRLQGEEIGAYLEAATLTDPERERLTKTIESLRIEERPKVLLHGQGSIPRTHTGKIQRRKLQSLFSEFLDCKGPLKIVSV